MSTIHETILNGEPLQVPFIDTHGHFGHWPETVIPHSQDGTRIVAEMDRYGCDMAWMSAANPGYAGEISVANDCVFDLAGAWPNRIIPYCTLSAHRPERNVPELRRCLGRGRCIGVKMHRYHQPPYTLRSDWLQPVLELLAEHRLVYLNHDLGTADDIRWAAAKYRDLTFLTGHFAPFLNDVALETPNLRICTCAALGYESVGAEVRRLGRSDTMLLGSDFGLFHLGFGIGMIAYADMPEEHKENIIGRNALRILEGVDWFEGIGKS